MCRRCDSKSFGYIPLVVLMATKFLFGKSGTMPSALAWSTLPNDPSPEEEIVEKNKELISQQVIAGQESRLMWGNEHYEHHILPHVIERKFIKAPHRKFVGTICSGMYMCMHFLARHELDMVYTCKYLGLCYCRHTQHFVSIDVEPTARKFERIIESSPGWLWRQ